MINWSIDWSIKEQTENEMETWKQNTKLIEEKCKHSNICEYCDEQIVCRLYEWRYEYVNRLNMLGKLVLHEISETLLLNPIESN